VTGVHRFFVSRSSAMCPLSGCRKCGKGENPFIEFSVRKVV
jgi:hypothetical protein